MQNQASKFGWKKWRDDCLVLPLCSNGPGIGNWSRDSSFVVVFFCILDVGPITHAFSFGDKGLDKFAAMELQSFKAQVGNLTAYGGGDHPEYALAAMLAALNYSFIDVDGFPFMLMNNNSELVVITDATSLEEELQETVITRAEEQGVSIHFILSDHDYFGFRSYEVYNDIADQTGGVIYRDVASAWSILKFYTKFSKSDMRRKRSLLSGDFNISVSMFTHFFRVSTLTRDISSGMASIIKPDGTSDTADITDYVMIYIVNRPLPGTYIFSIGSTVNEHLIRQDTALDLSLFYLDSNFTYSSPKPLPGCEFPCRSCLFALGSF